ncbi:MAG TPA: SUF system NifU family Fe-S cluster assembly protein [Candidatus Nanoarchaeia archaeon]|nr:SUF system NifU family Fe-S cluster assembly protein [Candidatus Nanoarchaeia archaeon]
MSSEEMYQEIILDYWKNPKNFGTIENPTASFRDSNPSCGDVVQIDLKVNDKGNVEDIKFCGQGCVISQAAAAMLTEHVKGKPIDKIKALTKQDILKTLGINLSPIRIKCALLSLKVLKYGLYSHLGKELGEEDYDTA